MGILNDTVAKLLEENELLEQSNTVLVRESRKSRERWGYINLSGVGSVTLNGVRIDGPVLDGVIEIQDHIVGLQAQLDTLEGCNAILHRRIEELEGRNANLKDTIGEWEDYTKDLNSAIDRLRLQNAVLDAVNRFNTYKLRKHNAKTT